MPAARTSKWAGRCRATRSCDVETWCKRMALLMNDCWRCGVDWVGVWESRVKCTHARYQCLICCAVPDGPDPLLDMVCVIDSLALGNGDPPKPKLAWDGITTDGVDAHTWLVRVP